MLLNAFSNLTAALLLTAWLTAMVFAIEDLKKRKNYEFVNQLLIVTIIIFLLWVASALVMGVSTIIR